MMIVTPSLAERILQDCTVSLSAANNRPIKTFGTRTIPISLGFGVSVQWNFIVADIPVPILGMDFLHHNKMMIHVAEKMLINSKTGRIVKCNRHSRAPNAIKMVTVPFGIHLINTPKSLADIVKQFEELGTSTACSNLRTTHQIETQDTLRVFARPRRLDPEKTAEVKKQLGDLQDQGIIRPSSSNWASPIHLVKKSDGSWRMCGDYRALNAITVPDRYNVPYLQDFSYILFNCVIFSKADLLRAFHQVPMEDPAAQKYTSIILPSSSYS